MRNIIFLGMKNIKTLALGVMLMSVISSCWHSKNLNRVRLQPYENHFKVICRVLHEDKSNSKFLIETNTSSYRLTLRAYGEANGREIIYDESISVNDGLNKLKAFKLPINRDQYVLEIIATNLATKEAFKDIQFINKEKDSEQTILVKHDNQRLMRSYLALGSSIQMQHTNPATTTFYVRYYQDAFSPARPPHIRTSMQFKPQKGNYTIRAVSKDQVFVFHKRGLYWIQTDTTSYNGLFINCFRENYPQLSYAPDLIESTRYITKNVEYESMNKSENSKAALDAFWLTRGETKNRAKELISIYYNRIQLSNEYFTTYKEGWKTDRGIIYTIYGPPDRVQKTLGQEYWYYERTDKRADIEFFFSKKNNQYILKRLPFAEFSWKTQIYEWRKGVVQEEY